MTDTLEQLALLDTLIGNWAGIRTRMGPADASLQAELDALATRLVAPAGPDGLALLLDDLLDLLEDTPAYDFVRSLLDGALPGTGPMRTAGADFLPEAPAAAPQVRADGTRELAGIVRADTDICQVQLYFATNRQPTDDAGAPYSDEPAEQLQCGVANVSIPVARHRLGHTERRPWWKLLGDQNDPRRYIVLHETEALPQATWVNRLQADPAAANGLLLFTHGYRVTFEAAARNAAQLAFDLKFDGRILLFSWPSLGRILGYSADEDRAQISALPYRSLLSALEDGPWEQVHLIAHSMGNRVLLNGLGGGTWPNRKLRQVMFVAADVQVGLFRQHFEDLRARGPCYTSYASSRDRALLLSSWLHRTQRVGAMDQDQAPFTTQGLETVDASAVSTGLGHSYFAQERSLLTDIGLLLRLGLPADDRDLRVSGNPRYWRFPR